MSPRESEKVLPINPHKICGLADVFIRRVNNSFVTADAAVRSSPEFQTAILLNPERVVVKVSLQKAFGSNYQDQVLGIKKIGPRVDRQYEKLDFSNGSVQGFYNYNEATNSYDLETLFPTQYPAD